MSLHFPQRLSRSDLKGRIESGEQYCNGWAVYLLQKIQVWLLQEENQHSLLQRVVTEARQGLQVDRVAIYQFAPDGCPFLVVEAVSDTTYQGRDCQGLQGLQDLEVRINDAGELLDNQVSLQMAIATWDTVPNALECPVLQRWGALVAQHYQGERVWQPGELESWQSLGLHLAIALRSRQLTAQVQQLQQQLAHSDSERTQQLQRALDYEALLKRITDKVRDSLDETQIWQTAVRELTLGLEIGRCNAALYDLDQGTSTICSEYAAALPAIQGRVQELGKFPELYEQLIRGQYFQFCSLLPNPTQGRVAMLACPILDDQGVIGDLWLVHQPDHSYSELEIRLVQQVANQCAIAIRQARLFQSSQAQVEELEKLNRLKDDFLSRVSHELRTPVANMKVAIQVLTMALKQLGVVMSAGGNHSTSESVTAKGVLPSHGVKIYHYLQILQDECDREINLVNDLLDLQSISEDVTRQLETLNLNQWLPLVLKPFQIRTHNRHQFFNYEIEENLPPLIIERHAFERILSELLNNACKYTPPGEKISLKVTTTETPTHQLKVQVINTGIEIAAHELPRIFEKFYRVPSADRWRQGGTGLGLALVQKLVEHLGGAIAVESEHQQTLFTLSLPLAQFSSE